MLILYSCILINGLLKCIYMCVYIYIYYVCHNFYVENDIFSIATPLWSRMEQTNHLQTYMCSIHACMHVYICVYVEHYSM